MMKFLNKWKKLLLMLLIALLLVFAFSRLDGQSVLHSVRQIPVWIVFFLIGLQIISQLLVNFQWFLIAKRFGTNLAFGKMLEINCRGNVIDAITPGVKIGGEVTRAVQIRKLADTSGTQAASIVAVQKMFSVSALCLSVLLTVGFLINHLSTLIFILPVGVIILVAIECVFAVPKRINAYMQKKAPPKSKWINKARTFLITVTEHLSDLPKMERFRLSLLSFLIWVLYPVKLYILTTQLAPDIGIGYVGAIAFASYIVAMLPIFPGGLGGFEGTMTGLFLAFGLIVSDAAVITVLFRFLTFWLVLLLSLAFIGCLTLWKKRNQVNI